MPLADQLCHRTISWSLPFLPDDFNLNSYRVSHLKVRPLVSLPSGGSHISTCPSFSGFHFPFLLLDPTFRQFLCATKFLILNLVSISSLALAQTPNVMAPIDYYHPLYEDNRHMILEEIIRDHHRIPEIPNMPAYLNNFPPFTLAVTLRLSHNLMGVTLHFITHNRARG